MEQRVVITGIGAITPVGNNIAEMWSNMVDGKCGIDFIKGYDEYNLPVKVAGQVKDFDASQYDLPSNLVRRSDLYCQYAMAAAAQAMKDSGLASGENIAPERIHRLGHRRHPHLRQPDRSTVEGRRGTHIALLRADDDL